MLKSPAVCFLIIGKPVSMNFSWVRFEMLKKFTLKLFFAYFYHEIVLLVLFITLSILVIIIDLIVCCLFLFICRVQERQLWPEIWLQFLSVASLMASFVYFQKRMFYCWLEVGCLISKLCRNTS